VGELNDQETQIDSLHSEINTLSQQRDAAQADLEAYLSNLSLE
jgi:hypothetical protein